MLKNSVMVLFCTGALLFVLIFAGLALTSGPALAADRVVLGELFDRDG